MPAALLTLDHVSKIYGSGPAAVQAVNDVDLILHEGEIVLLMGPSGSGKTTLLSIIGALLRPTGGKIFFRIQDITAFSERHLADFRLRTVGFIFQAFNLLSALTAEENVAIVGQLAGMSEAKAREKAQALLSELGLEERLIHLPRELSGGEQQRVAIARALINDPELILADEPTGNLDSRSGRELILRMRTIAKNRKKSVLIASHDGRIVNVADRILTLEDGRIVSSS